jgi:plastocyanin
LPDCVPVAIVRRYFLEKIKQTMKSTKTLITLGILAATLPALAGDITGKVTLKGTPPAEKEITSIKDDANCGKLHTEAVKTRFYVVGKDSGLADTVVVLKNVPNAKSAGAAAAPLVVDQKGCFYTPYVAACQTGQKITVKNSDPVLHNVHTEPAVSDNKSYNVPQMAGGADLNFTYDKAENFLKFKCDVHPWMFAYVTVVDHPYFAVTDKDGNFTIKDVPAGKYTIAAAHRKAAAAGVEQAVEVKADGAKADFTLEVK